MTSLKKALEILSLLGDLDGNPAHIGEISRLAGLPVATCGRLLRDLCESHYVEKAGPRKGFGLGLMAYRLARGGVYRKDLVYAAEPLMLNLAKQVEEKVVLVTLSNGRRVVASEVEGDSFIRINSHAIHRDNIYATATGRILLAGCRDQDLEYVLSMNGLPGDFWPEAKTTSDLVEFLHDIRKEKLAIIHHQGRIVHIAVPVYENDRVSAALGIVVQEHRFVTNHKQEILDGLVSHASKISGRLSCRPFQPSKE